MKIAGVLILDMQDHFYARLPLFTHFHEVTRAANYTALPGDWFVLIADVIGSTKAIAAGRYKEVNVVGASAIIAVMNAVGDTDLPYTFGGDGASMLVPPSLLAQTSTALCDTRRMARDSFSLELRIADIPVADVRATGKDVTVACFGASADFSQAMFCGRGVTEAERLAKSAASRDKYELAEDDNAAGADFTGLECRWQGIRSRSGETISLLVQVHPEQTAHTEHILDGVLKHVSAIYGDSVEAQPVSKVQLNPGLGENCARAELGVSAHGRGACAKALMALVVRLQTWIAAWMMAMRLRVGGMNWGNYNNDVVAHTDYRKFDDTLRMVLDSSSTQRERLEQQLEQRRQRREIVYGVRVAQEALMTCLTFDRRNAHTHFVDGANGGYALAAQKMKAQLNAD